MREPSRANMRGSTVLTSSSIALKYTYTNIHDLSAFQLSAFTFQLFSNLQIFYVLLPYNSSQGIRILPTNYTLLASLTVVGCCLDSPKTKISFYGTGGYLYHLFPLEKCHLSALEIWCRFGHSPKGLNQKQLDV